jgi:hypothetical protein
MTPAKVLGSLTASQQKIFYLVMVLSYLNKIPKVAFLNKRFVGYNTREINFDFSE